MYKSLTKHLELDGKFLIDENQVLLYKVVNTALYSKNFFFFNSDSFIIDSTQLKAWNEYQDKKIDYQCTQQTAFCAKQV